MKLTFYGHASLGIETNGSNLLVDPFISGNEQAKHIDIDAIKADYILVTHAHQDHILDVERICKRTGAKIVSNYEIVTHFGAKDLPGHPMNHGGKWKFEFGTLKYVNAVHSSSFPDGSYGGNPGGFVLTSEGKNIYLAGDTALMEDMKSLGTQFDFDWLVLPVGNNFTMGYEDAAIAAQWLGCKKVIGIHFDTFGYIEIDHHAAQKHFSDMGLSLSLLSIGETIDL
ncbi:MAG: metal-dependent hydrolase [Flavobacteriaceae bacterium]|nr:metal-dependent hydrolase [Flavobacteriaceae bacterium]